MWSKLARDSWLLFRRSWREGLRNPTLAFILPIVIPLCFITLISGILRDVVKLPGFPTATYVAWQAPGVVLLSAMMGAGYSAVALVVDAQSGYLDRLRLLPVHPMAIVLGRVVFDVVRVLPAALVVLIVSVALGGELRTGVAGGLAILGLVAFWAAAYAAPFYALGLRTRNAQAPLAFLPLFVPLMFLSTVFTPTSMMPDWIKTASVWNPFTYIIEGARIFMTVPYSRVTLIKALAVATGVLVIGWYIAGRSYAALLRGD